MFQKTHILFPILVAILGLLSCEKHEEAPLSPEQREEQEYIEEQSLTITAENGIFYADNKDNEVTLFEGESGELSLSFDNNNGKVVFKDITLDFDRETQLTTPNVTLKGKTTTVNIYFTDCSEGFVTYNLKDVRTSSMYQYTYFIHTEKDMDTVDDTPEEEDNPEQEDTSSLHFAIENKRYILKDMPLDIEVTSNQVIDTLIDTHNLSLLIDNKETQYDINNKGNNLVLTCPSIPQEIGKHEVKLIVTPLNEDEKKSTLEAESVFSIVELHHQWFRDWGLTSEMYWFHDIFNTRDNKLTWLKVEIEGAEGAQPTFSVQDVTDGKDLKSYKNGLFLLEHPSRGEHTFNIRYTLGDIDTIVTDIKNVKDEYQCAMSIDGSCIYATTNGLYGTTADITTDFTVHAAVRAAIPYTKATTYAGSNYTCDEYEYVDFQWVKTSFRQMAETVFGTYTLQKGWINTALNWARGKMSSVAVLQNGASRWVTKNGEETIEYYTPVPYLQVAVYFEYKNSEGKNLDHAIWTFDCSNVKSWLEGNEIDLAVYLLN